MPRELPQRGARVGQSSFPFLPFPESFGFVHTWAKPSIWIQSTAPTARNLTATDSSLCLQIYMKEHMGFLQESNRPLQGCFNLVKISHFLDMLLSTLQSTESSSTVLTAASMFAESSTDGCSPALAAREGSTFPASSHPLQSPSSLFWYWRPCALQAQTPLHVLVWRCPSRTKHSCRLEKLIHRHANSRATLTTSCHAETEFKSTYATRA